MSRRSSALTPLAIVLPHPPLPHRRSSLLSLNSAASPHTPRSCHSPVALPIYYPANRNSTDSWNSSNADDMDVEWKQEHVSLLSRTLDALPAHLVTPFNGPVPPSNLLDKIARGVSQAKGPADWPYSIRATRIKLLELARTRAKEEALADQRRHAHAHPIVEEELYDIDVQITDPSAYPDNADRDRDVNEEEDMDVQMHSSYYLNGEEKKPLPLPSSLPRKPLYRQSSMDFIKPGIADLKDNPAIARLSSRLQRTDRIITTPSYHPYSRGAPAPASVSVSRTAGGSSRPPHTQNPKTNNNKAKNNRKRSTSPPHSTDVPGLIDPSTSSSSSSSSATPSSTTLNSLSFSSLESAPRILRRSGSTLSSGSLLSVSASSVNGNGNEKGKGDHNNAPAPLSDPRIQRVRRSDSQTFSASFRSSSFSTTSSASSLSSYSGLPPVPPPKDFPVFFYQQQQEKKESQKQGVTNANAKVNAKASAKTQTHTRTQTQTQARAGFKRAPSYGALAQEARLEAKQKHQATTTSTTTANNSSATPSLSKHQQQQQQKEPTKAGSGSVGPTTGPGQITGTATNANANTTANANAHTRNLSSGSYPSSDEEEKARTTRAKKMKMRNVSSSGGGVDTMMIPTTPTTASPPPSSVPSSPAQSDVLGSPMSIPRTPTGAGAGAGVKVRTKVNKEASTRIANGNVNASKPAGISLVNKGLEVKVKGKTGKMENGKDNKMKKVDKDGDKDKEMMMNVSPSTTTTTHHGNAKDEISPLPRKRRAPITTHSSIPIPMNPQRNPSMFGIELVNVPPTKGRPSSPSVRARVIPEKGLSSPSPAPAPALAPASVQIISSAATAVNATPPPPTRIHVLGTSTRRNLRSGSGAGGENALGITPQLQQIQVKTRAAPLSPSLADALGFGLSSSEERERERERVLATSPTLDNTLVPTAPSSPVVGYKQGRGHKHMSSTSTCASVSASASVSPSLAPSSPVSLSLSPSAPNPLTLSPSSPTKIRTLRRVRRLLAPARRISFGSLVAPPPDVAEGAGEEGDSMDVSGYGYGQREREGFAGGGGGKIGLGMGLGLGSAFQLH